MSKIALEGVEDLPHIERIDSREEMIQLEYPQSTFQILLIFLIFFYQFLFNSFLLLNLNSISSPLYIPVILSPQSEYSTRRADKFCSGTDRAGS